MGLRPYIYEKDLPICFSKFLNQLERHTTGCHKLDQASESIKITKAHHFKFKSSTLLNRALVWRYNKIMTTLQMQQFIGFVRNILHVCVYIEIVSVYLGKRGYAF